MNKIFVEEKSIIGIQDYITSNRKVVYFCNIGVNNIIYMGKNFNPRATSPLQSHIHQDSFEICYYKKGRQNFYLNDKLYEVKGGDIFISLPDEVHTTGKYIFEISEFYWITFFIDDNFLNLDKEYIDYIRYGLININKRIIRGNDITYFLFTQIFESYFFTSPIKKNRIYNLLSEFLYEMINLSKIDSINKKLIPDKIIEVIDYIDENPNANITIEDLAKRISYSVPYFKEQFVKYVGMSPHKYIMRQKIILAAEMLEYTELSVTEIAYEFGFSSSQHFSTIFRKYESLSPLEYRHSIRNK